MEKFMKKRIITLIMTLTLLFSMMTVPSAAISKPDKVTILSATVDENDNVTVTWNKVKCDGYKIENGYYFYEEDLGKNTYIVNGTAKTIKSSKTKSCKFKRKDPNDRESTYCFRVRAYNKYKKKLYYNTRDKWWVAKKPSSKNWKGRKTKKVTRYKYSSTVWIEPTLEMNNVDITTLDSPEGLSKSAQTEWYARKFSEKIFEKVKERILNTDIKDFSQNYIKYLNIIKNTNHFTDLSNSMKVFVINQSGYFSTKKSNAIVGTWKMTYDNDYGWQSDEKSELQLIKDLYNGTAKGVCSDFVNYELAIFKLLNIEIYPVSNGNHVWTVIKVTNSNGKLLYIPFDYGIVTNTTDEQYLIKYCKGIKGVSLENKLSPDYIDYN